MPLAAAPRPIVPLWAAVLTSVASGVLLTLAFPALSWWPMAFPAVVLALIGLVGQASMVVVSGRASRSARRSSS